MKGMIEGAPIILLAVFAIVGIVIGAIFAAADSALDRITRAHVTDLRMAGRKRAEKVSDLVERRRECRRGANFMRIIAEMSAAVSLTLLIAGLLPTWWAVLLASIGTSVVLIAILMGISPREIGRRNPAKVLHALQPAVSLMGYIARPFVAGSERRDAARNEGDENGVNEDLRDMVDRVSESEHIEDDEREMLHSVFELGRTLTREVMVPRTDMITVHGDAPLDKALALFIRSGFSRVPVIGENTDDILGVLYLKDALRASRQAKASDLTAVEVARPARLVPEMKLVDELMGEMQAESYHIAIVIDEYGGVAGLVTMEDLIEELVGEVQDEHDRALTEVEELGNGRFRIPARLPVDELGDLFEMQLTDEDVDTAGGLLAKALGKVPIEGTEVEVHGLHLLAERAGGRRRQIVTIVASRAEEPESDA